MNRWREFSDTELLQILMAFRIGLRNHLPACDPMLTEVSDELQERALKMGQFTTGDEAEAAGRADYKRVTEGE